MEESKSNLFSSSKIQSISQGVYEARKPEGFPFDLNALCKFDFKIDFGFDSLKDSIEWLAKRQSNMELRMDKYGDQMEENNQKISEIEDSIVPAPIIDKPPPAKIEALAAPVITIVERKADYEITPEDLNKIERMIKGQEAQIVQLFAQFNIFQDETYNTNNQNQGIMQANKASIKKQSDGQYKINKSLDNLEQKGKDLDFKIDVSNREISTNKNNTAVLQAQVDSTAAIGAAQLQKVKEIKAGTPPQGGIPYNPSDKMQDILMEHRKRLDKLEKEDKKEQATIDRDQSKEIDDLKKMLSAFGSKLTQMKSDKSENNLTPINATRSSNKTSKAKLEPREFESSDLLYDIEKLKDEINLLKKNKVTKEEFELSTFHINERIDMIPNAPIAKQRNSGGGGKSDYPTSNNAPTDAASKQSTQALYGPSTLSNIGASSVIDDQALKDLAYQLANLQKQQDFQNNLIDVNKAAIQELQKKTGDTIGRADMEKVNAQMKQQVNEVNMMNTEFALIKDQLADLSSLKRTIAGLMKGPSESDFVNIRGRIEVCEKADSNIRKSLAEHEKKLKGLGRPSNSQMDVKSNQPTDEHISDFNNLRKEFEEFRDAANKEFSNINTLQLPKKANVSDLEDLEDRLWAKIQEIEKQFVMFGLATDCSKRFNTLNRKIKELLEMIRNGNGHQDDGMLTKKNLGPVACATCEKDLINLQGLPVDYHVWKNLPTRDTSERIARYGQGFSKILANLRGEADTQFNHASPHVHDKMTLHQQKVVTNTRNSIDVSTTVGNGFHATSNDFNDTSTAPSNFNVQDGLNTIQHGNTGAGFFKGAGHNKAPSFNGNFHNNNIPDGKTGRKHSSVIRNTQIAQYSTSSYPGQAIYQNNSVEELSRQSPVPSNQRTSEMNMTPQHKFKHANKQIMNTDGKASRDISNDGQLPTLSTTRK